MTDVVTAEPLEASAPRSIRTWWARVRPHPGLRARITLAFALSAALLSVLLAGTTWALTRQNIISQRESSATRGAFRDAEILRRPLQDEAGPDSKAQSVDETLASLQSDNPAQPLLRGPTGRYKGPSAAFDRTAIPPQFLATVMGGQAARMRLKVGGEPQLLIGVPLPEFNSSYFELVPLTEVQSTLEAISITLFGAALLTTLAGAATGLWASRRTLRPLAEVSVAAESIAGGRLDTRLGAIEDPDLGVLVTSFNHMAHVLEERIDHDSRFASDVSHELRSPLMTLSASIEVLAARRDDMPDASAQAAVDLMVADVARFKQLVEDLLEISRFDAGAARLDLSEVRPGQLVTQAVTWSPTPDVPVELDSDLAGMVIRADKRRLARVVANLLDNARKYGGGATRVELRRLPESLLMAVEDAGPGVPPDERNLVFDRFSRGLGSSRRAGSEGVGLGLSLVAEHVTLHRGRVWVEDRPDGEDGARFVVELPVNWDENFDDGDEDTP